VTPLFVFLLLHADLVELDINLVIILGQAAQIGEVLAAVGPAFVLGEETGRLGREDETDEEEKGKRELETGRNAPPIGQLRSYGK
jgi:hypothetical protein